MGYRAEGFSRESMKHVNGRVMPPETPLSTRTLWEPDSDSPDFANRSIGPSARTPKKNIGYGLPNLASSREHELRTHRKSLITSKGSFSED